MRDHRVGNFEVLLLFLFGTERGRRINVRAELFGETSGERLFGLFQAGAEFREVQRQLAQHVGLLRTLAGEEKGNFAARRTEGQIDALRIVERLLGFERGLGLGELGAQIFGRRSHDGQASLCGRGNTRGRSACRGEIRGRGIVPDVQLGGPLFGLCYIGRISQVALKLLQHRMKIGAAKAERTDAAAARCGGRWNPRQRLGVHENRRARFEQFRIGLLHVQGSRQRLVIQRQRHLHQPGNARGGLGVAHHGLHRSDRAALRRSSIGQEHIGHRRQFTRITQSGARAVGFNQADRRRTNARSCVGALQRQDLALQPRRSHAAPFAVARSGHALDDCVDAIAIAFGIFEALQHHHADAFADGDAVGALIEGAATAPGGERLRLGETQVAEGTLRRIDAAHDGHVAGVIGEFPRSQIHSGQRRSTSGIHAEVYAAEIEAVSHASRGYVQQQAGEGILGPLRQFLEQLRGRLADELLQHGAHGILQAHVAQPAAQSQNH